MQLDWIEFRRKRHENLHAFVSTLGFSRGSYVEFIGNIQLDSLLRCHVNAVDFCVATGVPKAQVRQLATLAFIGRNENVVLLGPSEVGKNHIAVTLGVPGDTVGK